MKQLKYLGMMLIIIGLELVITFGLFLFVNASKLFYVLFSLLVIFSALFYIFYTRYQEKIKIKPKKEILDKYGKIIGSVFSFVFFTLLGIIILRAVSYLIFQ
jgi:hypothetical protein